MHKEENCSKIHMSVDLGISDSSHREQLLNGIGLIKTVTHQPKEYETLTYTAIQISYYHNPRVSVLLQI